MGQGRWPRRVGIYRAAGRHGQRPGAYAHAQSTQEPYRCKNPSATSPAPRFGVLFIGALIIASLWVLRPFIAPTIWATMIAVTTWPMLRWFEARLWGRRSLAVLVMTLLILTLLVVPLMLAIGTIVEHADEIVARAAMLSEFQMPATAALGG